MYAYRVQIIYKAKRCHDIFIKFINPVCSSSIDERRDKKLDNGSCMFKNHAVSEIADVLPKRLEIV